MDSSDELKRLLEQIAETAYEASNYASQLKFTSGDTPTSVWSRQDYFVCIPQALSKSLVGQAIENAANTNPENLPSLSSIKQICGTDQTLNLELLARHTERFWEPERAELTVSFLDKINAGRTRQVIQWLNSWRQYGGPQFRKIKGIGDVRISIAPTGNWSYTGTDIKLVPIHQPTTNLGGLINNPTDQEFRQLVEHQAGHLLGFSHTPLCHQQISRIDNEKLFAYMQQKYGWSPGIVGQQVLALHQKPTAQHRKSLMSWQLPSSISLDNKPILGAARITEMDIANLKERYVLFKLGESSLK